ncbi:hypothetical protein ACFX11_046748 [Malus domestica]
MKRENTVTAHVRELPGRITRVRAASLHTSGHIPPPKIPSQQSQKQALQTNSKRAATDENITNATGNACIQRKRRAVLQDATNAFCKPSYANCFNATKIKAKNNKPTKKGQAKLMEMASSVAGDSKTEDVKDIDQLENQISGVAPKFQSPSYKADNGSLSADMVTSSNQHIVNIDADYKDPLLCSLYAPDIYNHSSVAEVCVVECRYYFYMYTSSLSSSTSISF